MLAGLLQVDRQREVKEESLSCSFSFLIHSKTRSVDPSAGPEHVNEIEMHEQQVLLTHAVDDAGVGLATPPYSIASCSLLLSKNVVVPVHRLSRSLCAVDLVVQLSCQRNSRSSSSYFPLVILTAVSAFAGGAPCTLSGVKRVRLGLRCTHVALSPSTNHSSALPSFADSSTL